MSSLRSWRPAALALLLPVLAAFSGCSKSGPGSSPAAAGAHPLVIGVSYQNLQNEFVINMQDAIRARAKELGVELIELDAQGAAERQISHVETFLARGVDAIILNPEDQQGDVPAVERVVAAHKPIIVVNAIVANLDKATAYVGSQDVEAGRIAARRMLEVLDGKGDLVVIHGPYGHSAEVQRTQGIREIVGQHPDARVISEQTANWDRAQALSVMENWLGSGRKIDGVIAQNDEMALGAEAAIAAAHQKIPVIGIDAIPDALRAVGEGRLIGTVFQDSRGQGATAVTLAVDAVHGKAVPHDNFIPFQLVTKDNLAKFLPSK